MRVGTLVWRRSAFSLIAPTELIWVRPIPELICRRMKDVPFDRVSVELWTELTNTIFRVANQESQPIELTLVKVVRGPTQTPAAAGKGTSMESFSLVFNGSDDRLLPQKTYSFEHDQLGCFDLFIVPIGRTSAGCEYEAVFNRLLKPA
jgi:hypothetical protein